MNSSNPEEKTAEAAATPASAPSASSAPEPAQDEEVIDLNLGCLRQVEVEVPAEVLSQQWESTIQRYRKVARVPGFRKGKAPASIVRNRFAEDIKKDVLAALVPEYFRQAVVKEGYRPISEPELHSLEMQESQPLRFKAAFEILPDIQLGNYQDIKVEKPEIQVSDEDVERELKQLQERQASFDPVDEDRPLREGDFAQISFQAKEAAPQSESQGTAESAPSEPKGEEKQPVHMDEVLVEIGGANTMPEFSEHLRGAKTGDEKSFDVAYPADYYEPRLAGKTMSYLAKVNAIKKKTTPELTDDFARELGQDLQTLDDLKKRLRDAIYAERQHRVSLESRDKLLNQLADMHQFPVPETLIRRQIDFRLEQWLRSLAAQGMRTEDMKRMDFKRLRASQRDAATKEVKANLLLEKIAEVENIQASEEEVDQEISNLAQQTQQTPEAVRQRLSQPGGMERIRNRIRTDKSLRSLYEKSISPAQNGPVQK